VTTGSAWSDAQKTAQRQNAASVLENLRQSVSRGEHRLTIAPGDYRFDSPLARDFVLEHLSDFTVEANGATFWFDPKYGVRLRDCHRVQLKGLTIDTDPLPWLQGRITAVDPAAKTMEFEVEPGFPSPRPAAFNLRRRILFFDPETGHELFGPDARVLELAPAGDNKFQIKRFANDGPFTGPVYPHLPRAGDRLVINDETGNGGNLGLTDCSEVLIERVSIYASANFAFHEEGGDGANIYRQCRLVRRPGSSRLMASRGDAFHSTLMRHGPVVEGCEISSAGDDLLAIQGFFGIVLEVRGPRDVVVASPFGQIMQTGSTLRGYHLPDGDLVGEAEATSMSPSSDPALLAAGRALPETIGTRLHVRIRKLGGVAIAVVHLSRDLELRTLDVIGCDDFCGAGAVVRNNYLHDGHIRGILVKSHDTLVENNVVERTAHGGIAFEAELYWLEGPFNSSAKIMGNRLVDNGWGAFYAEGLGPIMPAIDVGNYFGQRLFPRMLTRGEQNRDFDIENNTIVRPAGFPIWVRNTERIKVVGNRVEEPFAAGQRGDFFDLSRLLTPGAAADSEASAAALRAPYYGVLLQNTSEAEVSRNAITGAPSWFRGPRGDITLTDSSPVK